MQEITVTVSDKAKAYALLELLKALDFVDWVKISDKADGQTENAESHQTNDFFALAGLWAERDITLDSIRRDAWPRQQR